MSRPSGDIEFDPEKRVARFDPDNYPQWRFNIMSHLAAKQLLGAIDHRSDDWRHLYDNERDRMRKRCFNIILNSLGSTYSGVARNFQHYQPDDLWRHIAREYSRTTLRTR